MIGDHRCPYLVAFSRGDAQRCVLDAGHDGFCVAEFAGLSLATAQGPLNVQVGGGHYKDFPIQPVEFITKNGLGYIEGAVIKYVCRHRAKNGREDIEKAIHYLQLLLELNYPKT